MLTAGDAGVLRRRCAASETRAAADDMDWLAHDRLGFNYRLSDVAAAIGVAQLERARRAAGRARAGRGAVRASA